MAIMTKPIPYKVFFGYFVLFNLLFFFLQALYQVIRKISFIHAIPLPPGVYWEIAATASFHIILYLILSALQTLLLWGLAPWISAKQKLETWQTIIFFTCVAALISLNCYFFPLSTFSKFYLPETPAIVINVVMGCSLLLLGVLALLTLARLIKRFPVLMSILIFTGVGLNFISFKQTPAIYSDVKKPNIIIIGIDSLSPGFVNKQTAPTINKFLTSSVRFNETISPLARTYPAWISILTGLYPINHYARENLYPAPEVKTYASFAWQLRQLGYDTIFATDERRFSNLGEEFGFQKIIGPRIGVNDILLGSFNDFPLSNLLVNLPFANWILPYNHINRASFYTYYHSTFDNSVQQAVDDINHSKPVFFAIHYTSPHWPYALANTAPEKFTRDYDIINSQILYNDAVKSSDQEIAELLGTLKKNGLLENSLVILLSDHGEALYKVGSRQTDPLLYQGKENAFEDYLARKTATPLQMSVGHGSDLLSPSQFHCLLGFKLFKEGKLITKPRSINIRVALIDIAPTIAQFLNFSLADKPDGISLLPTLLSNTVTPPANRVFFLESGILPNQFFTQEKIISYAQQQYTINPKNNLLEVRQDKFIEVNNNKLYGILDKEWLLALYPDDKQYVTVLLNLSDGKWTDDMKSDFAQHSPMPSMIKQLRDFYKIELLHYPQVPTNL